MYGIILQKVLQIKFVLLLRKINYVNLNLVKFQLQSISQQNVLGTEFLFPFQMEYLLPRMLLTLSVYFLDLIQA